MQIKKRLRINAIVSLLIVLVIGLVLILSLYRLNKANNLAIIAGELLTSALERVSFRNDYIRNSSVRAKEQWFAKNEQIGSLLESARKNFQASEDRKIIGKMIEGYKTRTEIFSALVANREKSDVNSGLAGLSLEVEERLLNQLNIRVYEIVIQGRALLESSAEARASALRLAAGGVISALLVILAAAMINQWTLGRAITDRINRLRDGASVIGGGTLDHRIDIKGDDEFVDLSEAFNAMTAKLSGSYHALENEIMERTRFAEALSLSEERYRMLFDTLIEGFCIIEVIFDSDGRPVDYRFLEINPAFETQTGLKNARGMLMRELAPDHEAHWFEIYGKIAVTGEPASFINEARALNRWYDVFAYRVGRPENRQVAILFNDITERKRAEEALRNAHDKLAKQVEVRTRELHEKEVLLKEVHHRVKNNMQVISSLVSLQADNSKDETVRETLRDVTYRVRSMALVHEKLYQSADLARIDFAEYVRSLLSYLWRAHGAAAAAVRLTLDLTPVSLPVDTAIPCGLILNELAGNALKHAFQSRNEGEVTVSLQWTADGRICLRVRDNGVGIPAGFDWRQACSLGLRLVQMLAEQLDAMVDIRNEEGTVVEITFGYLDL